MTQPFCRVCTSCVWLLATGTNTFSMVYGFFAFGFAFGYCTFAPPSHHARRHKHTSCGDAESDVDDEDGDGHVVAPIESVCTILPRSITSAPIPLLLIARRCVQRGSCVRPLRPAHVLSWPRPIHREVRAIYLVDYAHQPRIIPVKGVAVIVPEFGRT